MVPTPGPDAASRCFAAAVCQSASTAPSTYSRPQFFLARASYARGLSPASGGRGRSGAAVRIPGFRQRAIFPCCNSSPVTIARVLQALHCCRPRLLTAITPPAAARSRTCASRRPARGIWVYNCPPLPPPFLVSMSGQYLWWVGFFRSCFAPSGLCTPFTLTVWPACDYTATPGPRRERFWNRCTQSMT